MKKKVFSTRNTQTLSIAPHTMGIAIVIFLPVSVQEAMGNPTHVFIDEKNLTMQPAGKLVSGRTVKQLSRNKLCYTPVLRPVEFYTGEWIYEIDGDVIELTGQTSNIL